MSGTLMMLERMELWWCCSKTDDFGVNGTNNVGVSKIMMVLDWVELMMLEYNYDDVGVSSTGDGVEYNVRVSGTVMMLNWSKWNYWVEL